MPLRNNYRNDTDENTGINSGADPAVGEHAAHHNALATASDAHAAALPSKADLVTGKVPTAQLGGAGADATKFLRGDQTWQVAGGGSAPGLLSSPGRYYGPLVATSQGLSTLDVVRFWPFRVGVSGTIDRLAIANTGTSGSSTMTIRMGIYADSSGVPGARLVSVTLPADIPAWSWNELVVSLAVTPGRYWLACAQNGTGTAAALSAGAPSGSVEEAHIDNPSVAPANRVLRGPCTAGLPDTAAWDWIEAVTYVMGVRRAA